MCVGGGGGGGGGGRWCLQDDERYSGSNLTVTEKTIKMNIYLHTSTKMIEGNFFPTQWHLTTIQHLLDLYYLTITRIASTNHSNRILNGSLLQVYMATYTGSYYTSHIHIKWQLENRFPAAVHLWSLEISVCRKFTGRHGNEKARVIINTLIYNHYYSILKIMVEFFTHEYRPRQKSNC